MKNERKKTSTICTLLWIALVFLLFWGVCFLLKKYDIVSFEIQNESLILTFVGILATFIVVSNYAQINDMKEKIEEELGKLNDFKTTLERNLAETTSNSNKKIESIRDKLVELETNNPLIFEIRRMFFKCDLKWENIKIAFEKLKEYRLLENDIVNKEIIQWLEGIMPVFREITEKNAKEIGYFIFDFSPLALNTPEQKEAAQSIISIFHALISNSIVRAKDYNATKVLMGSFMELYDIYSNDPDIRERAKIFKTYLKSDTENFKELIDKFLAKIDGINKEYENS